MDSSQQARGIGRTALGSVRFSTLCHQNGEQQTADGALGVVYLRCSALRIIMLRTLSHYAACCSSGIQHQLVAGTAAAMHFKDSVLISVCWRAKLCDRQLLNHANLCRPLLYCTGFHKQLPTRRVRTMAGETMVRHGNNSI